LITTLMSEIKSSLPPPPPSNRLGHNHGNIIIPIGEYTKSI
jgi:hypothetical protein